MRAMEEARSAAKLAAAEEEQLKEEKEPGVEDTDMEDAAKEALGVEPDSFAMAEVEAEFQNSQDTEAATALEAKQPPSTTQFSPSGRWPTATVSTSRMWSWTSCLHSSQTLMRRRNQRCLVYRQ